MYIFPPFPTPTDSTTALLLTHATMRILPVQLAALLSTHIMPSTSTSSTPTSTTPRFPSTSLTPEQNATLAAAEAAILSEYGTAVSIRDANGTLLGPFGPLSFTPTVLTPYLDHVVAVTRAAAPYISARERELVILATASVTRAEFVRTAHETIGVGAGLTRAQVEAAGRGERVEGLEEREELVYGLGVEMARGFGKLGDERFEEVVGVEGLGREGVSAVAQVVGMYFLAGVLVNVADVKE